MSHLLIIDDEPGVLNMLKTALKSEATISTALCGKDGIACALGGQLDALVVDVRLPDMSGLDVLSRVHEIKPELPVIVMTGFDTPETAMESRSRGAAEYLPKPLNVEKLRSIVREVCARSSRITPAKPAGGEAQSAVEGEFVGNSAVMQAVYEEIGRAGRGDMPVFLSGETGTGKELAACAVHRHSSRREQPFVALNVATIPEALLGSNLFGHERGSFTGADRQQLGHFEAAQGGTLFLDEVAEMSRSVQAKFLRVLDEHSFYRLGGHTPIAVSVRILSATNRDLHALVADGQFRADLLYRLQGYRIHLPPLRERRGDIRLLAQHFARIHRAEKALPPPSIAAETMALLEAYDWPGNVRELQNVIRQALLAGTSAGCIMPESLPESGCRGQAAPALLFDVAGQVRGLLKKGRNDILCAARLENERIVIATVLEHTHSNHRKAARLLGISRTTLRKKIEALGMQVHRTTNSHA